MELSTCEVGKNGKSKDVVEVALWRVDRELGFTALHYS